MTDGEVRERARGAPTRLRRAAIVLLTAGALLRILVAVLSSRVAPSSDMAWYIQASRALAAGAGLPEGTDRALVYPVFLGGLAAAGMSALVAIYLVQSVLTLGAAAATAWLAARMGGSRLGWFTLALVAPLLTIAQYSGLLLSESLFLPLFALWLALAWPLEMRGRAGAAWSPARVGAAGILAGIAGAVRPAALPLALGTCCALGFLGRARLRSSATFAVSAAAAFLIGVLGTAQLARVAPSFLPTSGVNLYLGNGPGSRLDGGGVERLPPSLETLTDPSERNARARREALEEMARRPLRTALVAGVRLLRLVSVNPGRVERDALVAAGWPSLLATSWLALEWMGLVALAAACWRAGAAARPAIRLAALVAAPYVIVLMATFVQTRFRLPLLLLLAPFAAAGLARLVDPGDARGGRRPLMLAALGAVALVAAATVVELLLKRG